MKWQTLMLLAAVVFFTTSSAMAVVAPPPSLGQDPGADREHVEIDFDNGGWQLDEYVFVHDPAAGWLDKWLNDTPGSPQEPVQPGESFPLIETFVIDSGDPVTDWHEIILTPGWVWGGVSVASDPTGGSSYQPHAINLYGPAGTPELGWDFLPPLQPGESFLIEKQLEWVGTPDNPVWGDEASETMIEISEYPTPEPTSIALLSLGGLALLRRRR